MKTSTIPTTNRLLSLRPELLLRAGQCEKADARFSCVSPQQAFDYRSIRVFLHAVATGGAAGPCFKAA
jgi:hypothetical protein